MKLFSPYLQLAPRRWGTARTEPGSSHSSWKGSRLLATPATAACLTCRPDIVCPNRLGGMMQPAKAAHCAFPARPSWGPRKAGRLCGERRSSVVIELSCLHGSERYAACFDEVVARAVRVSQPAVLSTLLVIQLFGSVFPPPNFSKEHQKERCGHFRPQRSFITFHGALWNILLSAGFPAMFHMIALEQTFVNGSLQKFFLLLLPFQIESILSVICISFLR